MSKLIEVVKNKTTSKSETLLEISVYNNLFKGMDLILILDYPSHSKAKSGIARKIDFSPKNLLASNVKEVNVSSKTFFYGINFNAKT